MEYLALNNGVRMPLVGFGTWTLRGSEGETCVREALDCGRVYVRTPEREKQVYLEGDAAGKTDTLFAILTGKKII